MSKNRARWRSQYCIFCSNRPAVSSTDFETFVCKNSFQPCLQGKRDIVRCTADFSNQCGIFENYFNNTARLQPKKPNRLVRVILALAYNPISIPRMANWLFKSAIQRVISILPCSSVWNELFQRCVTKSLDLSAGMFEAQLERSHKHLDSLISVRKEKPESFTAFEVGTGWYPTLPVGLYLCGAGGIWSFDVAPLLRQSRMQRMLQLFCDYDDRKKLQEHLPLFRRDRMDFLRDCAPLASKESPKAFLSRLNINVQVKNALQSGLPANSIDLSFSHAVLQHIPRPGLNAMAAEFRRLASDRSSTSHWINLSDLFSNSDRSITPFNCFQYGEEAWRRLDSALAPQNRLRISDYRQIFTSAGFRIQNEANTSGAVEDLEKVRLAPEFRKYSREDFLVLSSWLAATPA